MQWAASSFSKGTSNKAWWNSSSLAVGRFLGSTSRHFWINSCNRASAKLRRAIWILAAKAAWRAGGRTHPLERVLQGLDGTVYGFLRHVGGISITLDFQHSHLSSDRE